MRRGQHLLVDDGLCWPQQVNAGSNNCPAMSASFVHSQHLLVEASRAHHQQVNAGYEQKRQTSLDNCWSYISTTPADLHNIPQDSPLAGPAPKGDLKLMIRIVLVG